jgi:hypothetical protein
MKRPRSAATTRPALVSGDIKKDLTKDQLAAVGAISFAYNKAEDRIDDLFGIVTGLSGQTRLEVSTRIHGIDGKMGIILRGAKELGVTAEDQGLLEELLGEKGVFGKLKTYRDAVIHSRVIHAPSSIGLRVERKAKINEVLLSQPALDALYVHLNACCSELTVAASVLHLALAIKNAATGDPSRAQLEAGRPALSAQLQGCRTQRRSLPPIPKFPSESEFRAAEAQWQKARQDELAGWLVRPWDMPQHRLPPAWLRMETTEPPLPLRDAEKKKPKG